MFIIEFIWIVLQWLEKTLPNQHWIMLLSVVDQDFPRPRGTPAEITKQIRIPLIHDNYDEVDEIIVIELTSATNNYRIDNFGSRATGTITDHAK